MPSGPKARAGIKRNCKSGCVADIAQRGVEHLFYFQVDNPLVEICDPELIGYHVLSNSELTTQVVAKQDPMEKVGNVATVDGKMMIIEYDNQGTRALVPGIERTYGVQAR